MSAGLKPMAACCSKYKLLPALKAPRSPSLFSLSYPDFRLSDALYSCTNLAVAIFNPWKDECGVCCRGKMNHGTGIDLILNATQRSGGYLGE